MSKLYAIRQTKFDKYWYDFVEDFTSAELDRNCISNNFTYVKECQDSLATLNPAWKNSEIVEFRQLGDLDDFEDLYYKSIEQRVDLEAKLAKSEKRIQAYEEIVEQKDKEISFANRDKTCIVKQLNDPKAYVLLEDYKELKQQLAEKDKQVKKLNLEAQKYYEDAYCNDTVYQDKISFCIEKLERVDAFIKSGYCFDCGDVRIEIDNQIEQLKKGVE